MRKHLWLFVCCVGLGAIFTSGCQRGGKPTGEPDVSETSVRSAESTPTVVEKTSEKPGGVVSERPRQVTVEQVAIGYAHQCAVMQDRSARCWGANGQGECGNGDTSNVLVPITPEGMDKGVERIVVGESHTCALRTSGEVWCWGENSMGQLGNGTIDNGSRAVFIAE